MKSLNQIAQEKQQSKEAPPADIYDFFRVKTDADGNFKDVTILQTGFLALLRRLGFRRYDVQETFVIVRIEDNIIEQIQTHRLLEIVIRYFNSLDEDVLMDEKRCDKSALIEKLHRSLGTLTTNEKLSLLIDLSGDEEKIKLVEDEEHKAYFFYQNGFVEVTKDGANLRPYKDLPGYVWKDQILQRGFYKAPPALVTESVYYKFANNVSGNKFNADTGKWSNPERFASFITITGYQLHRYFKKKLRCTVFMDSRVSEEAEGRSGKSLHCKALREMLNSDPLNGRQYISIDGKEFDPLNRFKFDQLDISTRLVVLDDIKRGLQIENFFNAIVDGIVRERKGDVNKIRILAKIVFTLNYTLKIRGGSAKDRVIEFEFADHYSEKYSPADEFKHYFFDDWDKEEYNFFDNFMLSCVSDYLRSGIIMPATINLEARKLRDETSQEFIHFMEDMMIAHEAQFDKKELYIRFADIGDDGRPKNKDFAFLKQRLFTRWLKDWATYRPEMAGYKESRSNNKDYIRFFHNQPVTPEHLEGAVLLPGKSERCTDEIPF
jgi:hypothetical protein